MVATPQRRGVPVLPRLGAPTKRQDGGLGLCRNADRATTLQLRLSVGRCRHQRPTSRCDRIVAIGFGVVRLPVNRDASQPCRTQAPVLPRSASDFSRSSPRAWQFSWLFAFAYAVLDSLGEPRLLFGAIPLLYFTYHTVSLMRPNVCFGASRCGDRCHFFKGRTIDARRDPSASTRTGNAVLGRTGEQ